MNAAAPVTADSNGSSLPQVVVSALGSRTFERAPALRMLLAYLWQHRDESLSEYAIATEALGRPPVFDSKVDATVRVQISRLRQRLDKYYEEEGSRLAERIVIPLGTHQIRIEPVASTPVAAPDPIAPPEPKSPPRSRATILLALVCALLSIACIGLAVALARGKAEAKPAASTPEVPQFWKSFFGNGRPTRIILPTPVFFSFKSKAGDPGSTVMLRDTEINDYANRDRSPQFRLLERTLGPPQLASNYTVTSDTFASVRLARYLDQAGLATTVLSAADAPLEALDAENVIALGTWGTLSPLQPYLDRMDYVLGPHEVSVEVRRPAPGDPQHAAFVAESPEQSIWPGVIGLLPGRGGRTHLLVLASRHTSALVAFLTSSNGLTQLERIWKAHGSPKYYETIVDAEMQGEKLVRFWPVAMRPFQP